MSKDYKNPDRKGGQRKGDNSLLLGILIGLVFGLGIALGVAWYINKMPSPFLTRSVPAAKTETPKPAAPGAVAGEGSPAKDAEPKPRFDFYKILPGNEEPVTEQQMKESQKKSATAREAFFLQAGAFPNAADADNLKARLALLGVEAGIQTTMVPDKGMWHRVRIGPYTSVEELTRTRDTLKQNGVETALIKVRE